MGCGHKGKARADERVAGERQFLRELSREGAPGELDGAHALLDGLGAAHADWLAARFAALHARHGDVLKFARVNLAQDQFRTVFVEFDDGATRCASLKAPLANRLFLRLRENNTTHQLALLLTQLFGLHASFHILYYDCELYADRGWEVT